MPTPGTDRSRRRDPSIRQGDRRIQGHHRLPRPSRSRYLPLQSSMFVCNCCIMTRRGKLAPNTCGTVAWSHVCHMSGRTRCRARRVASAPGALVSAEPSGHSDSVITTAGSGQIPLQRCNLLSQTGGQRGRISRRESASGVAPARAARRRLRASEPPRPPPPPTARLALLRSSRYFATEIGATARRRPAE